MQYSEIPNKSFPAANSIISDFKDENLVDLYDYSQGRIICEMKYFEQGINGAINNAYVRETVAEMLMNALRLLPKCYTFKIFDAWRPYEVQYELYYNYFNQLKSLAENEALSDNEIHKKAKNFVSFPDKSIEVSFVHSTGGAIDLTIVNSDGTELDMGTEFDSFNSNSNTAYYETHMCPNQTVKLNRRLLYSVMTESGFTNLPTEWWHYDYGDSFWSIYTKKPMLYRSIYEII